MFFNSFQERKGSGWKQNGASPGGRILAPFWLRELDLNQRPFGYEPNELPDCSIPRRVTIVTREKIFGNGYFGVFKDLEKIR